MRKAMLLISFLALAAIAAGTLAFMRGDLAEPANKQLMLWASVVWFAATPFWMQRKKG
jgi:hypothetical protein